MYLSRTYTHVSTVLTHSRALMHSHVHVLIHSYTHCIYTHTLNVYTHSAAAKPSEDSLTIKAKGVEQLKEKLRALLDNKATKVEAQDVCVCMYVCMYVCVCVYVCIRAYCIHVFMYTQCLTIHSYLHLYIFILIHSHTRILIHSCTYTLIHSYTHTLIHSHTP